jgi:hypothetical protein
MSGRPARGAATLACAAIKKLAAERDEQRVLLGDACCGEEEESKEEEADSDSESAREWRAAGDALESDASDLEEEEVRCASECRGAASSAPR